MNKNTFTAVKPAKGEMNVYDFGTVKLHAYKTNDFIDNEVFIVEKNGKAVIIESPCFFDNISELEEYLKDTEVCGMLIAYHGAGASFLPGVPRYATKNAVEYSENGGGKALINNFTAAFGQAFDNSVHQITDIIEEGWYAASGRYSDFLRRHKGLHILFLELGVGFNTPAIIKYSFMQMTAENSNAVYACINLGECFCPDEISHRSVCIDGDIHDVLTELASHI